MSGAFDIQTPEQGGVFPGATQAQQPATEQTPPPAGDNEGKEREFVNTVRRLGRESGAGKEALPNLVVSIVEAIGSGALDPKKKFKLIDGTEAAAEHFIVEQYSLEEGRKLAHERTALGKKTQASKIKQIIKAAKMENLNFRGAIDRAMEARSTLIAGNDKARIKPAFDTYVSMARKQLETKVVLTNEQIGEATLRKAGYANDFVKELKRMYSRLTKLLKDDPKATVRISPDEDIYENMVQVAAAIEVAIQQYEPNFNKEEPAPAQSAAGQVAASPAQ